MKSLSGGRILSGQLPTVSLGTSKYRGVFYAESGYENGPVLMYAMSGDSDCARGKKMYDESSNFTGCTLQLSPIKAVPLAPPIGGGCGGPC